MVLYSQHLYLGSCVPHMRYLGFYAHMALAFQILYSKGFCVSRSISWCLSSSVPRTACFSTSYFPGSNLSRVLCSQDSMYLWSYIPGTQSSQYLMFPVSCPVYLS
ncbi:hypothetical protein KOW79_021130 [Hemibagrus wyckioides]|uniref:Uncharacterized protein n=1 Tax=Hemibagrus wyckioides TaxID=337641 RepID=A0A9D3N3B2_9TELE|nr:hypothetical protein KOW79_021130 [Hemibagrus wyckioides]